MFALVRPLRSAARWIAAALASAPLAAPLASQCAPSWQPGAPTSGTSDIVYVLTRAANGDLYAGGQFEVADNSLVHHVARWDGITWHALGTGTDGWVGAIAVRPNGDCIVGGFFFAAGGTPATCIAEWSGTQWNPLGGGIGGPVMALLLLPSGDVIAGGNFAYAGSGAATSVARWSNGTWSALGAGFAGTVRGLALLPNGDIVAGGVASSTGGPILQRWDGSVWTTLAAPMQEVWSLAVAPNGSLFVGGSGANALVSWDGITFQPVPVNIAANALLIDAATGDLFIGGGSAINVARWDGATLTNLSSSLPGRVYALAQLANGELVTGCDRASQSEPKTVRRLSGSTWFILGAPASAPEVQALASLANGDMVVGGRFQTLEGTPLSNIGRWDGAHWQPLGAGVDDSVLAMAVAANGDLIVGGWFTNAGGAPAPYVARWNGATWSTLGAGLPSPVVALTTRANGDVLAMSLNGLMRWNGSVWTPFPGGYYLALATMPNDDVVATGLASSIPWCAVIWSGSTPAPLGTLSGLGRCLLVRRNGELILGGESLMLAGGSNGVARWTGSAWAPLGTGIAGSVYGLTELPNGDLVAAAWMSSPIGLSFGRLLRWNGSTWSVLDDSDGILLDVASNERGELFAAGRFAHVGSGVAANFARSTPPCPASMSTYGAGCIGSAGPVALAAHSLPWAGSTFHCEAHGMAPLSLAVHVVGLAATTQPLPLGAPGCALFVDPILTGVLFPTGGQVDAPLTIPNLSSLVGAQLRTQVIGLELGSGLALLRTTGTNALLLTIGAL